MYYIVSLSGGISSAVSADLAIKKYGRNKVVLWFADTLYEDDDLYRFLDDCMARWGGKLYRFADGRTPLQVAEDHNIIPNQKIAPCTFELKIKPFTAWLWRMPRPVTVLLGFNWNEPHRVSDRQNYHYYNNKPKKPTGYQAKIAGVYEDYPLLWKPIVYDTFNYCRQEMGIEIPQMYKDGYDHNNCGGRCWRQSIAAWMITKDTRPELFDEVSGWELRQQKLLGTEHTIIRDQSNGTVTPYPLIKLLERKRVRRQAGDKQQATFFDDRFNCICGV